MGNKRQPVEKKRKKKGRPSLLDLQKRNLRLQKQQEEHQNPIARNPNSNSSPNSNPNLKFATRRSTRRNPNPNHNPSDDDDDGDERKQKKLKLVVRIPNGSDLVESGSDSEGSRKRRKIEAVETARQISNLKATDETPPGDASDSGPTTPLPDKKLLVFILDRLQKKDTYGVFSEPVDPEELPDYHDIIENPMDFGTVRKKLESGAYENLEQFESDVFLISSNAMRYNSSDTIYFRQARSIQELAKKDFENLRQESDDNEEEPKAVRRGRPPIKDVMKRIGRPPADRSGTDFSCEATLANARENIHKSNSVRDASGKGSSPFDKSSMGNVQQRSERNGEYSGSLLKGIPVRDWKKFSVIDENRRNTYTQPVQSTSVQEPSFLTAFEGGRKLLMPVGVYMEEAYARSLARFAANLGPIGWQIASKRIERVLPPGTKFGPGWIGENDTAKKFQPPVLSSSSQAKPINKSGSGSNVSASAAPSTSSRPVDSVQYGGEFQPRSPLQTCENLATKCNTSNGFNPGYGLNLPSKAVKINNFVTAGNSNATDPNPSSEGLWRGLTHNSKPSSVPPDLNSDFHSPGSPVSGGLVDSKNQQQQQRKPPQPHLALQL
ncbi:bromodomain-containing protein 2-like isoform X2 [Asparagus officinalis]|uniref:bromodomain-containing protein 2-like isoform X2 n=1 Tax=Asparagus officinalis TaxID=4686 RepID=UPI00098DED33|nr:bromodomain-containing protein 2-like isoform X2 [Asparagus officinalis]